MPRRTLCLHPLVHAMTLLAASPLLAADTAPLQLARADHSAAPESVIVTATREARNRDELAESVGVLDEATLRFIAPSHPAEALNRVAGVHVNNIGGEGHMTSIRQPLSTSGVYLFLEDGVPTRPSGFFNHNGLYEINIPQSSRVEVTKGPASALYGSDAIGGVINAITPASPEQPEAEINVELGEEGWQRLLLSGGTPISTQDGVRIDINATDSEGYRDESDYSRYATTVRMDNQRGDVFSAKTIFSYGVIDQSGVSELEQDDYRNNPSKNTFHGDIGYREVEALRLSSELSWDLDDARQVSAIPFYRHNKMDLMPSWMVTYDPNVRENEFSSYGALLKFRQNLWGDTAQVIVGMDVDYTPSTYVEDQITVTQVNGIYTSYQRTGRTWYDFDADQTSLSPYVHGEWQMNTQWRLAAGLRYDWMEVDYTDNMEGEPVHTRHLRPDSQTQTFEELSPKLSAIYQYADDHNAYLSYRHAFRAPTVGSSFRSGSSSNTDQLEPVLADSIEFGLRGQLNAQHTYEIAIYDMAVKDDIVNYVDDGDRKTANAGETSHQGVELALQSKYSEAWSSELSFTYTEQEYEDYSYISSCFPPACRPPVVETRNFAGYDVARAPETLGSLSVAWQPQALSALRVEAEWEHMGSYFTDETNTAEYDGHDLLNLRGNYAVTPAFDIYARLLNVTDRRYSTYTSNQVGDPDISYRPGMPRTLYAGVRLRF